MGQLWMREPNGFIRCVQYRRWVAWAVYIYVVRPFMEDGRGGGHIQVSKRSAEDGKERRSVKARKGEKKREGGGREKYLMANSLSLYTYMKDGSSNQVEMADRERRKMASRPMARRPDLLVALTDGLFFRCPSFSSSSGFIFPTIIKLKSLRLGPSWGGPLRYYLVPRWWTRDKTKWIDDPEAARRGWPHV